MKTQSVLSIIIKTLAICLIVGIGSFAYNAANNYSIENDFESLPLKFDPYDSSSSCNMMNSEITVYGGFIKGVRNNKDGTETLVIRALSPLPDIKVKSHGNEVISLILENINPDFYAERAAKNNLAMTKVKSNAIELRIRVKPEEMTEINPAEPGGNGNEGKYKYVILGDNRNGYDTFKQIIQQVNAEKPVFVIDNGDLVFSGKANQFRLFDKMVSQISTTLCTSPGNHDIRGNGKNIYKMLYGPSYYSFDFSDSHFVFLDSSPGWAEKQAISEEQYVWLEADLKKSQGKRIFVITHIPPRDPRGGITKNEIPNYVNGIKSGDSWLEQKLNNYSESKSMDHGFQDPEEASKFEDIMSRYHVDTVYLSHIHSYLEYTRDGVRYIITGGAGAELLTKNSYYHYMIAKLGVSEQLTIVELASPANNYLSRYGVTVQIFANAMYEENPVAVVFSAAGLALLCILVFTEIYLWKRQPFRMFGRWLYDTGVFALKRFKELFMDSNSNR